MSQETLAILIIFIVYMGSMIGVGYYFHRKKLNVNDYLLAGRKLNPWVASMSAQASDMSGWLLTGLPGLAVASIIGSKEAILTALGLAIGTILNWVFVAKRLRIYTEVSQNAQTLPSYFEKRFKDKKGILRSVSAIVILVFFTVYTASMFSAGAKLFNNIFGLSYPLALVIGAIVIVSYVFLGGFLAVSWTDLFQGILMFFTMIIVPIFMLKSMNGEQLISLGGIFKEVGNLLPSSGNDITYLMIFSALGWGLGYCGMPHILVRFMACKDKKTIKPATIIASVWVLITLAAAVVIGIIAQVYLVDSGFDANANGEQVFMEVVKRLFNPLISGILLSAVLAAIMSTADSQLLVASSAFSNDFYKKILNKNATDKQILFVSRLTIVIVSVIAVVLALDSNSSVFKLVSYAWAGFGASFGPLVVFSLYSKKITFKGAVSSIITGAFITILFKYGLSHLGGLWTIYEIIPGFILSSLVLILVSIFDKTPQDPAVAEEFEKMKEELKN